MMRHPRAVVGLVIAAALALVIGANWRLVDLALRSQPGCVPEVAQLAAAKPGC
jgi:hypothetical protein